MMRKLTLVLWVLCTFFSSQSLQAQVNEKNIIRKDTLAVSRDSLIKIILLKDSILLKNKHDSLKLTDKIGKLEYRSDSLSTALNLSIFQQKLDSAYRMRQFLNHRDFNRHSRLDLYEPIGSIDKDSIRSVLKQVVDLMYQDTSYIPKQQVLKTSMDRLVYHLVNDSTYFKIVNAKQDTIPFTLKKNRIDSTAFFVMNSKSDSAKLYVRSLDKNTLYMWVGDDLWLKQLLKKQGTPQAISVKWKDPNNFRVAHRDVPAPPAVYWNRKSTFTMLANQVALVNWVQGGSSNITFTADLFSYANYAKGNIKWDNSLYVLYSLQKAELTNLRKNQDRIELKSNLSHKAFTNFDYTLGTTLATQGFKGYNYPNDSVPVSKFFAPADLQINLGMTFIPKSDPTNKLLSNLKINMYPAAGSITFVLDTAMIKPTRFGLAADKRSLTQLGGRITINHSMKVDKEGKINMTNYLDLFTNYFDHPEKIDYDWRVSLDMRINRYLSLSFKTWVLYKNKVIVPIYEIKDGAKVQVGQGKRVQFQENFGISFKYIF